MFTLLLVQTARPQRDNRPINPLNIRSTFAPLVIQLVHPLFERRAGLSWRPCRGRLCRLLFRTCYERHRSASTLVLSLDAT
jgi:hypothetical protein